MHPLANLIPSSNAFAIPAGLRAAGPTLEGFYSPASRFVGAFCTNSEAGPEWANRIARYSRDEFHANSPGKQKRYGDVHSSLSRADSGDYLVYRHALELYNPADGQIEPYTAFQDYGSCVDACFGELGTSFVGWRARQPQLRERYRVACAWWLYAFRGYCSDGWDGFSLATKARQYGIMFREKYTNGSTTVNFFDDNANEQYVARGVCRSGPPDWLLAQAHPIDDGANFEFESLDVSDALDVFAAGGGLHFGGVRTSGGSRPFTYGPVGPHQQSAKGASNSEATRRFCQDTIGVKLADNDAAVVCGQTWGPGWSGECAAKYWPPHFGPKPEGAWIASLSWLLKTFRGDIIGWLPRIKGFTDPNPPAPPTPTPHPVPTPVPPVPGPADRVSIEGTLSVKIGDRTHSFIVVPKPTL